MGDISKNFYRSEFACKCGCGFDTVDTRLVAILEQVRDHFNAPVRISSGCRCPAYNERIGGEKASQHMLGRAADIQVAGASPGEVAAYVGTLIPGTGGLGRYASFTHVDTRTNGPARWGGA